RYHERERALRLRRRRDAHRCRQCDLRARGPAARLSAAGTSPGVSFLERALDLAERGRGTTHPNPVIGAVVVRDGDVVGEGWTEPPPGRHGEIVALDEAGENARGSTLYLTMEPCTHHGRTPPCVERVLAAGVARVVAGSLDPN